MKNSTAQLEIDRLNKVLHKRMRAVNITKDKIQSIQESKILPELKKQYEGKYFKFMNSFGPDDSWPLYSHCIEMKSVRRFLVKLFETDSMGKSTFSTSGVEYSAHIFQTQITKREYERALKKFLSNATKLQNQ